MLFNSVEFLLFFPIVTVLFYLIPHKFRWIHLLSASCIFYMFFIPEYILILFVTILIDYFAGILIERSNGPNKKLYLIISIVSTCAVLFIFKYYDFFNENIRYICSLLQVFYPENTPKYILPIGLSFHTFQSLSYVIEVFKGKQKAEKHFGIYSLYVMFYPQLVTGPIERPQSLLVQLRQVKKFTYSNIARGLRLIVFGLFIKMVIADNLAVLVDRIYEQPESYSSFSILTGLIFYSIQIYCDFYGYSTIAVGCALTLGFTLMDNFRQPYFAKNIAEFWQKWHISLSTWFRDYVYIPLGGSRVKTVRWIFNIMMVFVLSGLWHGANWTFIIWGLVHGLLYISGAGFSALFTYKKPHHPVINTAVNVVAGLKTFLFVTLVWVFFRATDLTQVENIFHALLNNGSIQGIDLGISKSILIFISIFLLIEYLLHQNRFDIWCELKPVAVRWGIYSFLIFSIIAFSSVESYPFIYFQF